MKKYTPCAAKWFAIFTIFSVTILLIGIVLVIVNSSSIGLQVGLTMLGTLLSIIFLGCFWAERSRWLKINDGIIILPRGADNNGKTVFKRTIIEIDRISSIEINLYKGDGLISKDTYFYALKLKDGTKITFNLSAYGKEAEKEILDTIKKSI